MRTEHVKMWTEHAQMWTEHVKMVALAWTQLECLDDHWHHNKEHPGKEYRPAHASGSREENRKATMRYCAKIPMMYGQDRGDGRRDS